MRKRFHLPSKDSYEDAVWVAAIILLCACLLFMILALVVGKWAMAVWTLGLLLGAVVLVVVAALVIENNKK